MSKAKPYLVFAVPRSGGSPVTEVLGEILKQKNDCQVFGELFNFDVFVDQYVNDRLRLIDQPQIKKEFSLEQLRSKKQFEANREHRDRRLDFIKKNHGKVFFKILPSQLSAEIFAWIESRYCWIFLERRDKWQHCLSFMVSFSTDRWYEEGGIKVKRKSLTAKYEDFQVFKNNLFIFEVMKAKIKNKKHIYFEDIIKADPASDAKATISSDLVAKLIKLVGAPSSTILQNHSPSFKLQNKTSKEDYFKNIAELRSWYSAELAGRFDGA